MIIIQFIYFAIIFFMAISGLFIIYHMVRYSYNKLAMFLMLIVFCSVLGVLLMTNWALFSSLDLEYLVSFFKL
jgi:hypothetical protein